MRTGCRGPLQFNPRIWHNGWEPLAYYRAKHPGETWRAICDYKTRGTPTCSARDPECCPSSKRVVRLARRG